MRLPARQLSVLLVALLAVAGGAGVAVAKAPTHLRTSGPTHVGGTPATAVFEIADRAVRQVRYRDEAELVYGFTLHNAGSIPVTVTGLAPLARPPRLFRYLAIEDTDGSTRFTLPRHGSTRVRVRMRMESCESLSARAGSFATEAALLTTRVGFLDEVVTVRFPEEVHTGSPREAFCPDATSSSRPPG